MTSLTTSEAPLQASGAKRSLPADNEPRRVSTTGFCSGGEVAVVAVFPVDVPAAPLKADVRISAAANPEAPRLRRSPSDPFLCRRLCELLSPPAGSLSARAPRHR